MGYFSGLGVGKDQEAGNLSKIWKSPLEWASMRWSKIVGLHEW
jgi:hypothetical protein